MFNKNLARHQMLFPLMFGLFFVFIVIMGTQLYFKTKATMEDHLKRKIETIVTLGAMGLRKEAAVLERIDGKEDMNMQAYEDIVSELNDIRGSASEIRFAYIMRKTDDPNALAFVADADSLATDEELDVNGNGTVDEDEMASYPGDLYDISETPAMQGPAFEEATTDEEFSEDEWGTWMSGYAPIYDEVGNVIAILGIDVQSDVFDALSRAVIPTMTLLISLAFIFSMIASLTIYSMLTSQMLALEMARSMTQKNMAPKQ